MSTALGGAGEGTGTANAGGADGGSSQGGAASGASTGAGNGQSTAGAAGGQTAIAGGQGNSQASWRDSLPDDIKADPTLAKFTDVANLSKSYLELQKKIGQKGIIRPANNATPEEWQAFYESIGVPKADQYKLDTEKFKGIEFPKDSLDWAQKAGAKHGIRPEQMTELMQDYAQFEFARDEAIEKEVNQTAEAQLNDLKEAWGDAYGGNLKKGLVALNHLGQLAGIEKEVMDEWLNIGQGNDVIFIRLMNAASKLMGEDKLREGGAGDNNPAPNELDAQIKEVHGQLLSMTKADPRRQSLVDKYASLNKQRTGGR